MSERPDLGKAMREALPVYEASPALQEWAREEARKFDKESSPEREWRNGAVSAAVRRLSRWPIAAGLLIAAVGGWGAGSLQLSRRVTSPRNGTVNELVDAHVRSLMPGHLMDVASSDRHTVKPWFTGKTDIAPPVFDLSAKGFTLLGGRVDCVDGHTAAALAYGRRLHTINLFVWRTGPNETANGSYAVRGYSLLHWTKGGLSYWAVSDASPPDLEAFHDAYTQ